MLAVEARKPAAALVLPAKRASDLAKLNCAGAGCPERDGCRRYETRISTGKEVAKNGFEFKTYTWASFDVERARFGDCPARIAQPRSR